MKLHWVKGLVVLLLSFEVMASTSQSLPQLALAADYYLSNYDYKQAFELWSQVYKAHPDSIEAMLKVSELQLLLDGHERAQKIILDFLKQQKPSLSPIALRSIRYHLNEVQVRFVKDESQSLYFQALAKMRLLDFSQGLNMLNQALNLERGNVSILEAKAKCEKKLGLFSKYYQTLKTASEVAEMSEAWTENLIEARYYFKDYAEILNGFQNQDPTLMTQRQTLAVGMAFLEQGNEKEAAYLLLQVNGATHRRSNLPILWYGLGKIYMKQPSSSGAAIQYFERFLTALRHPEISMIDGWDPYRSQDKVAEVKSLILQLKQRP